MKTANHTETHFDKELESMDDNESVNLSLFSLDSESLPNKINYGKIGHYSPFERFINFRNIQSMSEKIEFIQTYLKHYRRYIFFNKIIY